MDDLIITVDARLNAMLHAAGLNALDTVELKRFADFLALLIRWNSRMNLTAIRDPEEIMARHFVESIACAGVLPLQIESLLDYGSGAGFPGIPIAIVRPEILVTLAESQNKKVAFLHEAVRVLGIAAKVHAGRAQFVRAQFDCVTLRAVDSMVQSVQDAHRLVRPGGWLVVMTTSGEMEKLYRLAPDELCWQPTVPMAGGEQRMIAVARVGRSD